MLPPPAHPIISFMLLFSPLLLALSAVFLYAAVRQLGIHRTPAAFAALLFPISLSALPFLPGAYSSACIAALFLSIYLFFFCSFAAKRRQMMVLPSILFAFLSSYFNAAFGIAGVAAVLSMAAACYLKGDKRLAQFAILIAVIAAGMLLSGDKTGLYFNPQNALNAFSLSPFILAAASVSAVLFFVSSASVDHFLLLLSGVFVSIFSAPAGAMLLVLPAAGGMSAAVEEKLPNRAKLASSFLLVFVALVGLGLLAGGDIYKSSAIAAMLSLLAPLALHFYEYKSHRLLPAFALALLAASAFSAIFYSLPPGGSLYPQYADKDMAAALSYLAQNGAGSVAILGSADAVRFYLPGSQLSSEQDFTSYLLNGQPVPSSGSYEVISLSYLDDASQLGGGNFEAYYYSNNFTSGSVQYALFYSASGRVVARELQSDGTMALKDGVLLDSTGRSYASVPLSRMIMAEPGKPIGDQYNRMIVLDEGTPLPYFMKIYSGSSGGLSAPVQFGKVNVYKVG